MTIQPSIPQAIPKDFFTMDEASQYTGLSKFTLYGYTSKNLIPYFKLQGRKIYIKKSDLDNFIFNEGNRVSSRDEIESKTVTSRLTKG